MPEKPMPTVQQLPQATSVNLTDEIMLDQGGNSVAATVAQVLEAQPLGTGLVSSGGTLEADATVLAPLANPALTGAPTAPTPPAADSSTRIATTEFVMTNAGGAAAPLTLAGDITGSGRGTIEAALATVATPGTYSKVTVDAKGRVTAGGALVSSDVTTALGYPPLAGNQTITLAGDLVGSGTTMIAASLPSIVAPGAYPRVTVDAKGRVTAGGTLAASDVTAALGYAPLAGNQTITLTGDLSGSGTTTLNATLATVAAPGTYERVTIDAKGRVLAGGTLAPSDITTALAGADVSAASVTASGSATARMLGARAGDVVNVLDYGADPTGTNDSVAAFTAAMAAVPSGTWGRVFVPRGSYKLSTAVNQPSGRSIAVLFDDGANITGPGYLGVDRVESEQGPYRYRINSGGWFGFAPTVGNAENLAFDTTLLFNTPQNSLSMRVGWDRRYTNTLVYGKTHSGIDIAEQQIHSWPNMYDNSSGWGLWEVIEGTTLDEDTAARAGLSASCELSEIDIVNNAAESGWTWRSGVGNTVQGMSIDPWGQNGLYGGGILFSYGAVGSFDGNTGGLNQRWFSYPAVFSSGNPTAAAGTLVINGTSVNVSANQTLASIAAAINAANISNVRAAVSTWGGIISRLVIYGTQANDTGTLTLGGTALAALGLNAGSYTTPRGPYAAVVGGTGNVAVGDKLVVNGTTVTVGGSGTPADVAAAINGAGITGIAADTNANGNLVVTAYMPFQPNGLTLANATGYATLGKIPLNSGTFLPPTPPKAFATAHSDLTTPVCATTDQIALSATDANGTVHGPITITLNAGAGTGWPQDVAASISAALAAAGFLSSSFTALSTGSAVVAVRAVGSGSTQGVQIRNTAGGTLTLANAHGAPLDTLGIAPGTYQPGGYSAGSQTIFMAAEDAIAPGGRGVFIGGVSTATDLTVFPHTPIEARGGFLHGLRLDRGSYADGNAIVLGPTHAIAWGSAAQGQHQLTAGNGTLLLDGAPLVNSAALDGAFGATVGMTLYRGASGWASLAPGSPGQVLEANGAGVAPAWVGALPAGTAGALLAASGTAGVAGTISAAAVLDAQFGSEVGMMLYRGPSGWAALAPGNPAQVLQSNGAGVAPAWVSAVPAGSPGLVLAASGTAGVAETTSASAILDQIGATEGEILYRGASGWAALGAGGAGQVLQSNGAGAVPNWASVSAGNSLWTAGTVSAVGGGLTVAGAMLELAPVGVNQLLANTGTASGAPAGVSLGALLTDTFGSAHGFLYSNGPGWVQFPVGASGQVLMAGSPDAQWVTAIPSASAGAILAASGTAGIAETLVLGSNLSLAGNTLNATGTPQQWNAGTVGAVGGVLTVSGGTLQIGSFGPNFLLANASGGNGAPAAVSLSTLLDSAVGANQGDLVYRSGSGWIALAPGAAGSSLVSEGAGNPLAWVSAIPAASAGVPLAATGTAGVAGTLSVGGGLAIVGGTLETQPTTTVFTTAGTWTPRTTSTFARVLVVGGGGGGGGGAMTASGTACSGGGGGGGSGVFTWQGRIADIAGASGGLAVTVGAGGSAGAAATTNGTAGGTGGIGGTSSVANLGSAGGGGGGAGGQINAASGGGGGGLGAVYGSGIQLNGNSASGSSGGQGALAVNGTGGGLNGGTAGAGSSNNSRNVIGAGGGGGGATGLSYSGGASIDTPAGGGTGGGVTSASGSNNGGKGASCILYSAAGGSGGSSGSPNGGTPANAIPNAPGSGGGGGYGNGSGAGGAGGAGTNGGGGGGGGSCLNGSAPGAGGAGGAGLVVIEEW